MILHYQGRDWEFDQEKITVDQWRELKRKYKMTPKGWQDTILEADPDASTFLHWVLLAQNGEPPVPLNDALKPDIIALNAAIAAAEADEPPPEPPAGPTRPEPSLPVSPPPDPPQALSGQEGAAPPTA